MEIETYKDFKVFRATMAGPTLAHTFEWVHTDYDGPEDGRCGYGTSVSDCREQIDELLWDRREHDLESAIRSIRDAWACSDGGASGVESIASAIHEAMLCVEGITDQDIAETMPPNVAVTE